MSAMQTERIDMPVAARRGTRGYSLVELIAALFVLSAGLLGSIHVYYRGLDAMAAVREAALVSRAIRNEVETLRAQPYAALENGATRAFISVTPGFGELPNLRASVTIEDAFDEAKRMKKIAVDAAWSGEHGRTIHQTAVTLIADKEGP